MADDDPDAAHSEADVPRPGPPISWRDLLDWFVGDRRRLAGWAAAALLVAGLGLAGYLLLRPPPAPATELVLPMAGAAITTVPPSTAPEQLLVHAAGAVAVPGVHAVPAGSRVADLLVAAGGPAGEADLDRVNLAAAVTDGERVWFPRVGEASPPPIAGATPIGGEVATGPVDLNTASAEQLDSLPGIGPAIAAAIIEHRERAGPFASVDGLLDVPGIGDAKLAQLRDLVTV